MFSLCQKVDLFSLGIILFEMSYRPMTTGAERISVLSQLRGVSPCSRLETFCVFIDNLSFSHPSVGAYCLSSGLLYQ